MINRMIMCFLSLLIAFTGSEVFAEWKPNKPITMMVIFPPGGGGDTLGRATAAFMEKRLGSKIVVENRRGGGGAAMAKVLVKRKPDGYTIGMAVTETFSFAPVLNPKIGYDATDFTHLGSIANTQVGLVAKTSNPWKDLNDLAAAAKSGQKITIGTFSPMSKIIMTLVAKHFDAPFKLVPVRGGRAGIKNVMGGHISATLVAGPQAPFVRKGQLRVLASAEPDRLLVGKDAKTFTEYGVKNAFFNTKWMFSAPKGLAPNIVKAFSDALEEATKDKKLIGLITNKLNLRLEFTPADKLLKIIEQKQINGKARIKLVR